MGSRIVSNLAVAGVIITLLLLLALVLFDDSWEPGEAPKDALPQSEE